MGDQDIIALAIGSNMGDRLAMLRAAVTALQPYVTVKTMSPIYETPPAYVTDQPAFLNAALLGTTRLEPITLLRSIKAIEFNLGRMPTFHYGPRLIDLDIIFYGSRHFASPELSVPHPRMAEREFVLRPLADIVPAWQHPIAALSITQMLDALPEHTARRLREAL